jgi:2-C-methyl-D-erythritol 4-phosphate cytidylyltransferase
MVKKKISAIVLAAGQGKRMKQTVAKQYLELKGKPILYYSLKAFEESRVDEIALVTAAGQIDYCKENIVDKYKISKVSRILEGGVERSDSVYQALKALGQTDYVLIHDGARPFLTVALIENIIIELLKYQACIPGTPVKETIKIVDGEGFISSTPDRSNLWAAQTPQAFEYCSIRRAYELMYQDSARSIMTDDAVVYETYMKKRVKMLMGDYNNLKLTTPEDYAYAKALAMELL